MSGLVAIMDELAATLEAVIGTSALGEAGFQIESRLNVNPGDRAIDIYPGDPFRTSEEAAFGDVDGAYIFTVRARVNGALDGVQDTLLALLDDEHDLCVAVALTDDQSLNGLASSVKVAGTTGFVLYVDTGQTTLLGCSWSVTVLNVTT